jgi:hypothetical protein
MNTDLRLWKRERTTNTTHFPKNKRMNRVLESKVALIFTMRKTIMANGTRVEPLILMMFQGCKVKM